LRESRELSFDRAFIISVLRQLRPIFFHAEIIFEDEDGSFGACALAFVLFTTVYV